MVSENKPQPASDWPERLKARGWSGPVSALLDALEPIGPLLAQGCYVLEPVASLFGGRNALREAAQALESAEGIEALRKRLREP